MDIIKEQIRSRQNTIIPNFPELFPNATQKRLQLVTSFEGVTKACYTQLTDYK